METTSLPAEYLTWASLRTLAGAAGAVVVVANTARKLLNWDSPFIPFLASVAIVLIGAYGANQLGGIAHWAIAFLNACLLFCTATGANDVIVAAKPAPAGEGKAFGSRPVKFFQSWLT